MTQSKLEELLKIDTESYNLLRVLHMFMKLDKSQDVPLQAMAVFWFVATYKNCSKKNIEEQPLLLIIQDYQKASTSVKDSPKLAS